MSHVYEIALVLTTASSVIGIVTVLKYQTEITELKFLLNSEKEGAEILKKIIKEAQDIIEKRDKQILNKDKKIRSLETKLNKCKKETKSQREKLVRKK